MSKNLDDLLKSPARSAPRLPPETVQALRLIRIEALLVAAVSARGREYYDVITRLDKSIVEATAAPDEMDSQAKALQQSREAMIAAINDLSSFGNDPAGWIPIAAQRGFVLNL